MKKQTLFIIGAFLISTAFLSVVSAQNTTTSGDPAKINPTLENPFKCPSGECTLTALFKSIVDNILIPIGAVVAVIAFIWSGFLFVMAQGEPAKLETAKRALLYTAIGTAILLGAWTITKVITGTIDALK